MSSNLNAVVQSLEGALQSGRKFKVELYFELIDGESVVDFVVNENGDQVDFDSDYPNIKSALIALGKWFKQEVK